MQENGIFGGAMQRPYRNIGFYFLLLFVLAVAGFTPRVPDTPFFGYFSSLAGPKPIASHIHLHVIFAMAWLTLLCVQPFLIRANRLRLHRLLGWCSILVFAVFFITGVEVTRHLYQQGLAVMPRNDLLALLSQQLLGLTLALLFYVIALMRRRHLHQHVAFMLAAGLVTAVPGLARLGLYLMGGMQGILLVLIFIYASLVSFMLYAKFRCQQPIFRSPYLLIIALLLASHIMDLGGNRSPAWLWLADKVVSLW